MFRIQARELIPYSTDDLFNLLTGDFTLVFDDGELQTNAAMTCYSSFAWVFHRLYPNTPMLMKHHVQQVLRGKRLTATTHLDLLGNALWSAYDAHEHDAGMDRDHLAEILFQAMNDMYNDLSYRLEEYVTSMSILDCIELLDHPAIVKMKKEVEATPHSIKQAYQILNKVLSDPKELPNNPVALAYRSKLINPNQVQQAIGPRGYITDTDSTQFRYPVMRGYLEGLRDFYSNLIESRSAAKALQFSKANLRDAEYFSRKLQLACMAVKRLHRGDCATMTDQPTQYLLWPVKGKRFNDDGDLIYNELPLLEGKRYLDEETGQLKIIHASDEHLVGKTLKLRSVIHCAHPDPDGICATCFGELSLSVPKRSNIGHLCCVTMTEPSTQSVLSVKHLDGNATIEPVHIVDDDIPFLKATKDRQAYLLHERLAKLDVKFVIPAKSAESLNDIMGVRDVAEFNISRISEMEVLGIQYTERGTRWIHSAKVHEGKRKSSLTYAMLNHIRTKGFVLDNDANYVVDMEGWNYTQPILALPLRHFNMSDHSKEISSLLQATRDQMHARDKTVSPAAFLGEFFNLVNNRLQVNLAPLEVIMYSLMIISAEKEDYRLPKPWTDRGIGVHDVTMARRSLSATMAYQDHYEIFTSPESFVRGQRQDHIFDGLVTPQVLYGKTAKWEQQYSHDWKHQRTGA